MKKALPVGSRENSPFLHYLRTRSCEVHMKSRTSVREAPTMTSPGRTVADEPWRLDASELARLIRLGRVSSREATESCLSRLDDINPAINAVVRVLREEALAAADAADGARARGDVLG